VGWFAPAMFLPLGLAITGLLLARVTLAGRWWELPAAWRIALLGLMITSLIGLYPSLDLTMSLPRLYGIMLGIATFAVLLDVLSNERRLRLVGWLPLIVSVVIVAGGLAFTEWPRGAGKGVVIPVYDLLPGSAVLPYDPTRGINPNKLAAPLAMLLPFVVALGVFGRPRPQSYIAWPTALVAGITLLLTQSRSAYVAGIGAVLLVLVLRWRWLLLLLVPYIVFLVWVIVYTFGPAPLVRGWSPPPMTAEIGVQFEERRLVWDMAESMIEDFPLTGIGLGTFPAVADLLYGHALLIGPTTETPHAHNLLLETAVDLGLPGLGFFVLLSVGAARTAWRAIREARTAQLRGLAAGAACGLLAYYLFGLTDTIGLGEKPGILLWVLLGIVAACARIAERRSTAPPRQPMTRDEALAMQGAHGLLDAPTDAQPRGAR
jgi:putative inorganic carbon (hco3(-)) transporter